ncbi:MAG: SH3 domain-containing protein [Lachnospiraceae bacterium]|nr:SH3 domain-containing protein [Lachnospiraceae bacterium]
MARKRRKKRTRQLLMIAAVVFVLVIIVALVVLLLKSFKTLKSITLTPNFAETELDVNQDYVLSVKGNPAKANLKSIEYVVDDATATFQKGPESGMAVLHTGSEGVVTVYVKKDKIESNKITFQVVDQARKAEEEALAAQRAADEAAQAAAMAEQVEEEVEVTTMVMVTGDNVRMRAEPNTDCEIVTTCKKGDSFTKIEAVDDWTKIDYNGRECYIKSEFLKEVSPEEANQAQQVEESTTAEETKKEEKKTEEKKPEENKPADNNANTNANTNTQAADAQAAADAAAAVQAAADAVAQAAQAAAANTVTIQCKDGPAQFTKAERDYFIATWSYTGMAEEMMAHHSADELHTLYNNTH